MGRDLNGNTLAAGNGR